MQKQLKWVMTKKASYSIWKINIEPWKLLCPPKKKKTSILPSRFPFFWWEVPSLCFLGMLSSAAGIFPTLPAHRSRDRVGEPTLHVGNGWGLGGPYNPGPMCSWATVKLPQNISHTPSEFKRPVDHLTIHLRKSWTLFSVEKLPIKISSHSFLKHFSGSSWENWRK